MERVVIWRFFWFIRKTCLLLILAVACFVLLSVIFEIPILTNALSSNTECEEEIRLICRGMGSLEVLFRFTNVIQLPINASNFTTEPSFISLRLYGSDSPYGRYYASGWVDLNTTIISDSEGKSKADIMMAKFERILNISLPYNRSGGSGHYYYKAPANSSLAIQKFRDALLENTPSKGFDKILTPTLMEQARDISFILSEENGNLTWKTEVDIYIPDYIQETWFGWLSKEYTISLRDLANYSGSITSSPNSTKSSLSIRFSIIGAFLQIFPKEEVRCLEIVPPQMSISRGGEVFERDITGSSVEDLYIRFKWVMPWWSLIGVTVIVLGVIAFAQIYVFTDFGARVKSLKKLPDIRGWAKKLLEGGLGFLFFVGLIIGLMSILLIILNVVFLFSPSIALNQYGWSGFGIWLGIWVAIAVEAAFPLLRELKKWRQKRNESKAWELEDQLKGLKEQLDSGYITQVEYESKRRKLLEKSKQ